MDPASEPTDVGWVWSTAPDEATAERIARALVTERLAACVTRLGAATSCYRWRDEVRTDSEVLLAIKTVAGRLKEAEARLKALHPYECPEWLVLPVAGGSAAYLAWVRGETAPPSAAEGPRAG